jgi:hypothetical protein
LLLGPETWTIRSDLQTWKYKTYNYQTFGRKVLSWILCSLFLKIFIHCSDTCNLQQSVWKSNPCLQVNSVLLNHLYLSSKYLCICIRVQCFWICKYEAILVTATVLQSPRITYLYLFPTTTGTVASTIRRMNECQTQTIMVINTIALCNLFYSTSNWVLSLCWTSFLNTIMRSKYANCNRTAGKIFHRILWIVEW